MFHASPTIERQSILTNGLTPNAPLGGYPSGVYLFPDEGNALFFAEHMGQVEREGYGAEASSYDVWLVDTSGLTLLADPAITDDDEFQRVYPAQPLRSVYTTHRVGPERLTLRVAGSMPGHTGGSMPEHTGLISFPGPEYLVPGQRYNWWSDTAEPWMITGEPRDFDPGPHITFATYRGPHRHEQYTRAVPAVAGHQFEIHQGNYDRRATTVRATKDDISDPFSARWENVHVMDEPQLRDIMARGLFQTYSDPAPIGEVMEGINMQIADHENRQEAATPMTLPEGWTHEGTSDHEWEPFTFPTGAQVHLNWETNQIRDPDGEEHDLDQWLRYGGSYRDSPSRYVEAPDFHKQFWDDPQYLFHGTDQENVAPILAHGLEPRNKTRGIDNRSIGNAVFTTPHESVASYHYGPTLGIDAPRMKADGYMPIVTSDGMDEAFHRHAVAEALDAHFGTEYGYEYRPETGTGGEDPDTVVFHDHIPAKYITHIDDPTHYSGADPEVARIAARLRSATPHKSGYESGDLYHVAPRGVAGDIESSGLRPRADDESGTMPEFPHVPGVVYAYANHEHAQRWADALDRDSVIYRLTGIPDHRLVPDHEELDDALNEHLNFSAPGDRGLRDALHGIAIDGQPLTMWWKQRVPRNDHGGARSVAAVAGMPEAAQAAAGQVLRQFGQRVAIKGPIEPHHLERLPEPPRNDVPMAPSTSHKADYVQPWKPGTPLRPWEPGQWGKGITAPDGTHHTWVIDSPGDGGSPQHYDAYDHFVGHPPDDDYPSLAGIVIAPSGEYTTDEIETDAHRAYAYTDPRLRFTNRRDRWLRHNMGASGVVMPHNSVYVSTHSLPHTGVSYHLTDDEQFALDPEREPRDNTFAIQDRSGRKGLYLTSDPMRWFNVHDYVRPFVAEIEHPPAEDERWGGEQFLTADQFPHSRVRRVLPLDEYVREEYNERGPFEEYEDPQPMFGPREKFPAYQYTGPDVREMAPEEVARHKARVQAYLRDVRPHMVGVDGRCPACGDPGQLVLTPNPGEVSCNACGKRSPMPHEAREAKAGDLPRVSGDREPYYHVSPQTTRDAIAMEGLRPDATSPHRNPHWTPGTYLWESPERAREYAEWYLRDVPVDMYEVYPAKRHVAPDPTVMDDPEESAGAFWTQHPIAPAKVRLMDTDEWQDEDHDRAWFDEPSDPSRLSTYGAADTGGHGYEADVWHGTRHPSTLRVIKREGLRGPAWLTTDRELAESYGYNVINDTSNLLHGRVRLRNPWVIEEHENPQQRLAEVGLVPDEHQRLPSVLQGLGYDGFVHKKPPDMRDASDPRPAHHVIVAFEPQSQFEADDDEEGDLRRLAALSVRPHHFNRRTGLPCNCHYGRPRPRPRTASQAVRQLRNQNQKALRTPAGQAFLAALDDISDRRDIESLIPWLAKQFKEGAITIGPLGYEGLPSGANPTLYAVDAAYNNYPENIEYSLLPLWSQWMEARQHPLRRGRNIMQMGFDEVTALARDLREEVEARQIKKNWLEQYGGTGLARHTFNPSHADDEDEADLLDRHRDWRVHELVDGEDCEAESDALNHCIGSDDQPYKQNIIRGNIRAFSLRDPDGFPRVAWHHNPDGSLAHIQGRSGDPKQEWRDLISHFNSAHGFPDHVVGEEHLDNRDEDGYDPQGYDEDGYDRDGYNEEGYDRSGYDQYGYDWYGYNEEGYDHNGYDHDGYNEEGYDAEGYDNAGFNEEGYDRDGYDEEGYDEAGYNRYGDHRDGPQYDQTIEFPEPTTVADYLDQYHPDHEDRREEYAHENAEYRYDEHETQLVPGEPQFHDQYTWNGADPVQPGIVSELRDVHPDDRQNVYQTILHHHYDGGHPERFGDALAQQLRTQPNDPQTQAIAAEWETAWNRSHNPMTGAFVTPWSLGQVHRPDGTSYTDWSTAYDRQEPGFPLGDPGRYTEPATPFGPRSGSRPVIASARMSGGPGDYEIRPADEGWFSHDTGTFVPRRDSKGTDTLATRHGQGEGRVAYFNGEPVASVTWQRTPNAILLGSAYTHPDHRGKGLFNRLTEDIRTSGLPVDAMVWENPWLKRKVRDWPRRTSAHIDWRPDSRIAMPIVPTRWDALRMPRAEYAGEAPKFPDRDQMAHGSPEYLAWLDRVGPEFKAIREREHEWDRAARNAMATGRMTPEEVVALGYRPDSHEMDSNSWVPYEKNIGKWRPLPQALYHVTSNLPGVLHTGGLLSPDELDLEGKGRGLGGGTQDTISLTESLEEAQNIQRAILEGADVASGRLPIERLVEMAERGEGAKEPWLRKIFGEHDWSKGNPRALDDLLLGRKPFYTHLLPDDHPLKGHGWQTVLPAEEWAQHGYYPYDDAYTLGTPDSPKYMANTVYRHLTPEEKAHEVFEWWRNPYAPMRASSGGPDDPLFTSVDPHWFANLDPSHVGILQVAPVPGAHGYPLSSLGEWRIPTGDAVKLTHVNGQPYEADDPEHLGAVEANILDPIHETLDPAVFEDPHTLAPHLRPAQREWLLDTIFGILQDAGYDGTERWARLYLTGSLTTYQYADHSDCDISIFVNHHAFPEWSRAEMIALMVDSCDGLTLPGTPHELQVFVVAKSVEPSDLYKPGLRSGYDLIKDEWIVPPERDRAHDPEQEDPEGYVNGLLAADKMERLLTFEPERAKDYYAQLHRKRMRDQKDRKGDYSPSNLIYKMLANRGLFDRLRQLGVRVAAVPDHVPEDWMPDPDPDNVPLDQVTKALQSMPPDQADQQAEVMARKAVERLKETTRNDLKGEDGSDWTEALVHFKKLSLLGQCYRCKGTHKVVPHSGTLSPDKPDGTRQKPGTIGGLPADLCAYCRGDEERPPPIRNLTTLKEAEFGHPVVFDATSPHTVTVEDQRQHTDYDACAHCGASRSAHRYAESELADLQRLHRELGQERGPVDHSMWEPAGLNTHKPEPRIKYHPWVEGAHEEPHTEHHAFDRPSLEQALAQGGGTFKDRYDIPWRVDQNDGIYHFRSDSTNPYSDPGFKVPVADVHTALGRP